MTDKPDITEEEIRNSMNFDQVLVSAQAAILSRRKRYRRIKTGLYVAGIVILGLTGYIQWKSTQPKGIRSETGPDSPQAPRETSKNNTLNPDSMTATNPRKEQPKITTKKIERLNPVAPANSSADSVASTYSPAEPISGFPYLYEYFNKELKYPPEAIPDSTQGVITVNFIIDTLGQPKDLKIVNSLGTPFDKEARRLIENMPPWKPALLGGKPVDSKISIPLTFQIKTVKQSR